MKIDICTGKSRKDKIWIYESMELEEFKKRISTTTRTVETMEEYKKLSKKDRDNIKDVGGFVLGKLKDNKRKKDCLISRSGITLDMDYATAHIIDEIEMFFSFYCLIYSTHNHRKEKPRFRLIIPLSRNVSPDEYCAVSRMIAKEINIDLFDDTTYEPSRLMYWPSTSKDGDFVFKEINGDILNPDDILCKYEDWRDFSKWPVSSRKETLMRNNFKKQGDPLEKGGIIGVFCRAYSVSEAIESFLSDVYEKSEIKGRYDYIPASSSAGVVIYDDKFAYSHHSTDVACNKLLNAFDLVRIHKFGKLDDKSEESGILPSLKEMEKFVLQDEKVKIQLAKERADLAKIEFNNVENEDRSNEDKSLDNETWQSVLELDKQGRVKATMMNIVNIIKQDINLKNIVYNEFRHCIDVIGKVPWNKVKNGWGDADMCCIKLYFEKIYGIWSPVKFKDALLAEVSSNRTYHPIKEYFSKLVWDKKERLDRLLVDYLGAEDTPYVREVTRKTLVGAVARIYEPGIKFDSILVLNGPQGIGKSTIFNMLGKEWYSDSLTISDMKDKTAPEKLQGYWILELGELAGIRRIDVEIVKSFITRTDDKFRQAYGVNVESHPRSCVIVGTTNAETGFLRDVTGNRRFWPVYVSGNSKYKPWDLRDVDQVWAEAIYRYNEGEKLYLQGEVALDAVKAQNEAMELDNREGIIMNYLEKPLPINWKSYDLYRRRAYLNGEGVDFDECEETVRRENVCVMEIWCECFMKERSELRRRDSFEIEGILKKIGGWKALSSSKTGKIRYSLYGPQKTFTRVSL